MLGYNIPMVDYNILKMSENNLMEIKILKTNNHVRI